jgi:uncharacterized membrane protein
VELLLFAGRTLRHEGPLSGFDPSQSRHGSAWLDEGKTNIESALRQLKSSAYAPSALLLTDGLETQGSALRGAALAAAQSIKVFPLVEAGADEAPELEITQISAPLVTTIERRAEVSLSLRNEFPQSKSARLKVTQGTKEIDSREVVLEGSQELRLRIPTDPSIEGLNEVTAELSWLDDKGESKRTARTVFIAGRTRERIAVLSGDADDDRHLSLLLRDEAYQVDAWLPGSTLPLQPLERYSSVVINNLEASRLPFSAGDIRTFVERGGGLLTVGGTRAFGLGGYIGTAIEEILPVKLIEPQTKKKRLNVGVALVIDKSKSMGKDSKIEFARLAAIEVLRSLKDDDFITVIAFDSAPYEVVPMAPVSTNRATAIDKINRLFANEGTNLFPAMEEGWQALLKVNAGRKHMIIMTDGQVYDAGPIYYQQAKRIRVSGVTISTVLLGDPMDGEMLRGVADLAGGSYYQTREPQDLPRIFVSDVKVSTGEETLKEELEYPVRRGTGTLSSTKIDSFPDLRGYVETLPRPDANLELVTFAQGKAAPLLASRRVQNGRSIAFTSEANGRWSAGWLRWPRFREFWRDLLTAARPPSSSQKSPPFDLKRTVEKGDLVFDATVYADTVPSELVLETKRPDGRVESVRLNPIAPGRFIGRLTTPEAGRYEGTLQAAGFLFPKVGWSLSGDLLGERRGEPADIGLLSSIADVTGGTVNPSPDEFSFEQKSQPRPISLIPYLLGLAALTFAAEIFFRERLARRPK